MKLGNSIIILAVAAFSAVSCNLFNNLGLGVNVPVDKKTETSAPKFLGIEDDSNIAPDAKGDLKINAVAQKEIVSQPISVPVQSDTKIGELIIKATKPEIAKNADIEPAALILEFENPSPEPVTFKGTVVSGGEEAVITVVVPAGKKPHTVVFGADIKKDEYPAGTEVVQPEKKLEKVLAEPIHQDVKIGFELIPGTKTIAPAAASYTFKVDGSLAIPFSFPAGTKIYITRSFRDLGLNLGDYDIKADKFDIIGSITSTIPFDIACTGQDVNGVTAKTENPVKAGSTRNPVTSDVVIKVAGANAEKSIDEVQAVFELTATQGARLNKGQSLKINYDSIKVNI